MTETPSASAKSSISFSGLFLVAGLIMRYAVENKPGSPIDWDLAGLICIVIALLPLMILLGLGLIVGIVALIILLRGK